MLARRDLRAVLSGLMLMGCSLVLAADDEMPEMDFIEYLGMWEESDEVWLVLDDEEAQLAADSEKRTDPVPDGEESAEKDDET